MFAAGIVIFKIVPHFLQRVKYFTNHDSAMAIKPVLKMGDPRLLQVSEPLNERDQEMLPQLLEDMFDTMHHLSGAGIAAPQIGVNVRVVIFEIDGNRRYPDAESVPTTILINPEIKVLDETRTNGWEGCLSVPGMRAVVPRYERIRYTGVDENGDLIDKIVDGFHARVVQHECDHLDGVLYPMRVEDMSLFGFEDTIEWKPSCDMVSEN